MTSNLTLTPRVELGIPVTVASLEHSHRSKVGAVTGIEKGKPMGVGDLMQTGTGEQDIGAKTLEDGTRMYMRIDIENM